MKKVLGVGLLVASVLTGCGHATLEAPGAQRIALHVVATAQAPFYSTAVYQSAPGRVNEMCTPTLTGVSCTGTVQGPSYSTVRWPHVFVYELATDGTNKYVLECELSTRWSQCKTLNVGETFDAAMVDGHMVVSGTRNGKATTVKFNVLAESQ